MPQIPKLPFLLILLCIASSSLDAQPTKRALLVGVGAYKSSKYTPLNAVQGVESVRLSLVGQGFAPANIVVITDSLASKDGIHNAFKTLASTTLPGDIIVVHYYGHGVQVFDENGDEADQLDEAFVPYNGRILSAKDHRNLITDDELGRWVNDVRRNAGAEGQLFVVLDACHSGSGMRGRGADGGKPDQNRLSDTEDTLMAPLIAFYSSMPHQASYEMPLEGGQYLALLTLAFCKAMAEVQVGSTYRGLFERTALNMTMLSRIQTPQQEGDVDRLVFGGRIAPPPPYFKTYLQIDSTTLLVAGGLMHGLHPGAKVALYAPETRDTITSAPLARGIVPEGTTNLLECIVKLDKPLSTTQCLSAWIFVTQRCFSGYNLKVHIDIANAEINGAVHQRLSALQPVQIAPAPEAELLVYFEKGKLSVITIEGVEVWEQRYNANQPEPTLKALCDALAQYLQAQFLRTLQFQGSPYRADFTAQVGSKKSTPSIHASLPLRAEKDTAFIRVVNRGEKPVYYTIIDIDANNKVSVLLPGEGWLPADFRLDPGMESNIHRVMFDTPGREVLKLITTPNPIDLREAISTRGRSAKGRSFFENLFAETYLEGSSSRGPTAAYQGNEAGVETVILEVLK
ncbi:MAG: caspase family protein [Saprospiraceae bacterium]|nr:caspase family protein [Saprospiraceae bacterium]